jgi:hypothetical protein
VTVSLNSWALFDIQDEFKPYLGIDTKSSGSDQILTLVANWITDRVEQVLNRKLVTRGSITELHSPDHITSSLYLRQYPIIGVTSVHESDSRTYDSTTLLTSGTDYIVNEPKGKLIRTYSSGDVREWLVGFRTIQVLYTGGYADTASVPADIKLVAMREAAILFREINRKEQGMISISDAQGSFTRLAPAEISKRMLDALADHRLSPMNATGEVDS